MGDNGRQKWTTKLSGTQSSLTGDDERHQEATGDNDWRSQFWRDWSCLLALACVNICRNRFQHLLKPVSTFLSVLNSISTHVETGFNMVSTWIRPDSAAGFQRPRNFLQWGNLQRNQWNYHYNYQSSLLMPIRLNHLTKYFGSHIIDRFLFLQVFFFKEFYFCCSGPVEVGNQGGHFAHFRNQRICHSLHWRS